MPNSEFRHRHHFISYILQFISDNDVAIMIVISFTSVFCLLSLSPSGAGENYLSCLCNVVSLYK